MLRTYSLSGMTLVTPLQVESRGVVKIQDTRIADIGKRAKFDISLGGDKLCCPGLINVHDHMRGDYLPRIGPKNREYYLNWSYWERDLRGSAVVAERANITVEDCYQLAAYKNLFSGVVTVNDHFPHEFNEPFIPRLPIRVISEYTLAHECSSFDLNWGDGIEIEHKRAVKRRHPFITHLEEGYDQESQAGVEMLEKLECLDKHDVFIHGIGFSNEDIKKIKRVGATVVWCPASNLFMFNLTCKIDKMIEAGINLCIGTDSTHTGSVNLLAEMRVGRRIYRKMYGEDLDARTIVLMVTVNSAKAFWMQDRIGSIAKGKIADLLVVRPRESDPYEALVNMEMQDIDLLLKEGRPISGSAEYEELFAACEVEYNRISVHKREMLITGDPAALLQRVRRAVGYKKVLDYLPLDD